MNEWKNFTLAYVSKKLGMNHEGLSPYINLDFRSADCHIEPAGMIKPKTANEGFLAGQRSFGRGLCCAVLLGTQP